MRFLSTLLATICVPCFVGFTESADDKKKGTPVETTKTYEGYVNGVDVIATPGKDIRCLAFINKNKQAVSESIQISTTSYRLQSALENAAVRNAKVQLTYMVKGNEKVLTRVRMLDRK